MLNRTQSSSPSGLKMYLPIILMLSATAAAPAYSQQEVIDPQLMAQAEADVLAEREMTAAERRAFWADVNALGRGERLAYQRAYKAAQERLAGPVAASAPVTPQGQGDMPTVRPMAPGTSIRYDGGGAITTGGANSVMVGNLFDTGMGAPVETSGSITQISFYQVSVGGSNVFWSLFSNLNTGAGSADLVTSMSIPAVPGTNTHSLSVAAPYQNGAFLAGIWQFTAGSDIPGLNTGTTGGQGYHAVSINDIVGTGFSTLGNHNAMFRVHGNVVTPVELMDFKVK